MSEIIGETELEERVRELHKAGVRIVLTNGCYDLLHIGHLRTFKSAKQLGDILLVGINSDRSIRLLKGAGRPVVSQNERAELVAALKPVDFVTIFNDRTAVRLLEIIRPQVYVKGGDYSPWTLPEYQTLIRLGTTVRFIPLITGISTTKLITKIEAL